MLFVLAAIWGVSYVFIKVAVEDIEPAPLMAARALLAGLLLFPTWRHDGIASGGVRCVGTGGRRSCSAR